MTVAPARSSTRRPEDPLWWHHVDYLLVAAVVALSGFGALMVYSATKGPTLVGEGADTSYLERQVLFIVAGLVLMVVVAAVDFRRLRELTPLAYLGLLGLLAGVLVVGVEVNGAKAWFSFGSFQVQPSEFGKVVLVLTLAALFGTSDELGLGRVVGALAVAGLPIGLILLQPDIGTVLIYGAIIVGVIVVAGVPTRYLVGLLGGLVLAGAVLVGSGQLADYQIDRLTVFLDEDSESTAAYNVEQAQIAIGNGGLTGQGLFEGTQTRSEHVPEQQTDFIFTVVGEELGFVGAALLLSLYAVVVWRIWRIAVLSFDYYGTLVCVGVLSMLTFQVFQSIGMNVGMMPVTGIPLPFVSYGGSSMLTAFAAVGLALNVHLRRFS